MAADAATGMLLPERAEGALATYQVVSSAPVATLGSVPAADGSAVPAASASAADLALPPDSATAMATVLRFLAGLTGRRPAPTVAFLQAVMTTLHADERRVDPAAPPPDLTPLPPIGTSRRPARPVKPDHHGYHCHRCAATGPAARRCRWSSMRCVNQRRATPEQFATLYAMVARYLGVPARVVTGFRMGPASTPARCRRAATR